MAGSNKIKEHLPTLISLVTPLLLCVGVVAALWGADRVLVSAMDYSSAGGASTPSCISSLLAGDVAAEIGDMVFLNDVRLQAGPSPQLFVVSGAKGTRMLIALDAAEGPRQAEPMTVDIKGLIRRLPASAILRRQWKLTKDQIQHFGPQQIYIAAEYARGQNQDARAN